METLIRTRIIPASDALPLKAEFIKRGLPDDLIDDLEADIEILEQAITHEAQGKESHVAATAAIDQEIERGMNAVRELDAIVQNIFRNDPAALAEWASASHVERPPRRADAKAPPTPPPPAKS